MASSSTQIGKAAAAGDVLAVGGLVGQASTRDLEHALRMAAGSSKIEVILNLLALGVAVDATGLSGYTALQFAVWSDASLETVQLLVSHNACPCRRAKNKKAENAFDMVRVCKNEAKKEALLRMLSAQPVLDTTQLLPIEDAEPERNGVWAEPSEETAQIVKGNKMSRR